MAREDAKEEVVVEAIGSVRYGDVNRWGLKQCKSSNLYGEVIYILNNY